MLTEDVLGLEIQDTYKYSSEPYFAHSTLPYTDHCDMPRCAAGIGLRTCARLVEINPFSSPSSTDLPLVVNPHTGSTLPIQGSEQGLSHPCFNSVMHNFLSFSLWVALSTLFRQAPRINSLTSAQLNRPSSKQPQPRLLMRHTLLVTQFAICHAI